MKDSVKKLLLAAIYVILAIFVESLIGKMIKPMIPDTLVVSVIVEAVFAVLAVIGAVLFHKVNALKIHTAGLGAGLKAGLPFILVTGFAVIIQFLQLVVLKQGTFAGFGSNMVLFIINMLLIGVTEEILYRAIMQNIALDVTGEDTAAAVRKGILLAGVIFGLTHLINIFAGVSLRGVVDQAIMAAFAGAIYGAVYYRSKNNLLVPILVHAFSDFASLLGALSGESAQDTIDALGHAGGLRILSLVLLLGVFLFVTRKSVMEKAIEERKAANIVC